MQKRAVVLTVLLVLPLAAILGNPNEFLFDAVNYDNLELVKALLQEGADPNLRNEFDDTVLMRACVYNTGYEIAKLLITYGADVNARNTFGITALMNACESGNLDIIKLLIKKGAKVNAKTILEYNIGGIFYPKNFTALAIAEKNGFVQLVKYLKKHKALK